MGIAALVIKVITSWQVVFITVALALYIKLVMYVGQLYHRPRAKAVTIEPDANEQKESPSKIVPKASDDDDLGLEEE